MRLLYAIAVDDTDESKYMVPQQPPNSPGNRENMPKKTRIVFDSEDSSSEDDDAELGSARRLLANGGVTRRPQHGSAHAHAYDGMSAGQAKQGIVSLFGLAEEEFEAANSIRESDDSPAITNSGADGNAMFPPGLLDSDSDDNLLICLPIRSGVVEDVRRVSTETVGASSRASPQNAGLSSNDSSSDDDSSDDGFYDRDKKMPAKCSLMTEGNFRKDEESSDDDDLSDDGFNDWDKKMPGMRNLESSDEDNYLGDYGFFDEDKKIPAKRSLTTEGNGKRSKKSARDLLNENDGRSSDESSLLSSSESEEDDSNRHGDRAYALKGGTNSSDPNGSDTQPSSEDEEILKQVVASRSSNEGTVSRDYDPQIGDRVYACYDENDERGWYWGNTSGYENGLYSIRFEDGDYAEKVSRKNPNHILTVWEYMRIYETDPPPLEENDEIVATLSPRQMYASRCKWCELCMKPDCGSCATCVNNSRASSGHVREVCLQKMCLGIPLSQKKQPAFGLLPNWTYAFARNTPYISKSGQAHVPGLFIYHPDYETKTFRSIEAAVVYVPKLRTYNQNVVTDFNTHIGIFARDRANSKKQRAEPRRTSLAVSQKPNAAGVRTSGLSPRDLYANRCKQCELCMKEDCGACWSCKSNKKNPNRSRRAVCLKNMCLAIPDEQKEQPAEGLPPGYTFIFTRDKPFHHRKKRHYVPGLFISHPSYSIKTFRSIEAAVDFIPRLRAFNPNVIADFNRHIGVQTIGNVISSRRKRPPKASPVALSASAEGITHDQECMTLEDLYDARCGACENCCKDDCGQCSACLSTGSSSRRQVCIQKMCCEVPTERKAQPMPPAANFPNGWRFCMDPTRKSYKKNVGALGPPMNGAHGLKILPPTGQEYYSAETAKSKHHLEKASVDAFYEHIGAFRSTSQSQARSSAANINMSVARSSTVKNTTSSRKCGACDNCTKPSCGKCARCINSSDGASQQCFQKMCFELPVDAKAEHAIGLPKGWRFYFAEHIKLRGTYPVGWVPGLSILSKGGKMFRSAEAAARYIVGDETKAARKFYTHVGLHDRLKQGSAQVVERPKKKSRTDKKSTVSTDSYLIGRGVCFTWTDVAGLTKVVYGTVSPCEVDEDGRVPVDKFKVIFDPQSRSDANSTRSEGMPAVQDSRIFPLRIILGGCISLEQQIAGVCESSLMDQVKNEDEIVNWVVPNWRNEDQVVVANDERLPRLTLIVRGYRLELNVKQSTIPNAGYGVFLKCTSLMKRPGGLPMGPFELKAGELLDLGVYGPLRPSDAKRKAVFLAKDFIFSHKCEEWAFEGDLGNQIDITDDVTGDIHEEAKSHILAYVNENSNMDRVCVRAEHDAEGSVHYLLGCHHQSQESFYVQVDDDNETEIFVDYLDEYEKVRMRKGYSILPDGEKKDSLLKEIANDDVEYVEGMNSSGAVDVEACLDFLTELVLKEGFGSGKTVERTFIVAAILQRRAKRFLTSRNEDDHGVNMKKVFECSVKLVSLLLTMIRDDGELKRLHADGNADKVLVHALKTYFSAHDFSELSKRLI